MDQVIPGLWIGDLPSAQNTELLKGHGIYSILSAMRGRIQIKETFIRHQILLDDSEDEDVLVHLLPSIHFIQEELDKGRGVLVHCQAGISRSSTIVAAYLMHSRDLDTNSALELIRKVRPNVEPNQNFLRQLEIFHQSRYKVSRKEKVTRMYYMERTAQELLNGDGSQVEANMFAKVPETPGGPRRRIRCKMCREELATREHMLDHGQLGPPTPAVLSPATSRRSSTNQPTTIRRPSIPSGQTRNTAANDPRARRLSLLGLGGLGGSLSMSALDSAVSDDESDHGAPTNASHFGDMKRRLSGTKTPPSLPQITETPKETSPTVELSAEKQVNQEGLSTNGEEKAEKDVSVDSHAAGIQTWMETARLIGRRMSNTIITPAGDKKPEANGGVDGGGPDKPQMTSLISPTELAAQLYSNPKLAALRTPSGVGAPKTTPISPPILLNAKCSGYFVEPMDWMESFLAAGEVAGKIVCPNKKCGAKLGNYDWAGVKCGCKEWVVPGFCINRSKVDEIVV
ncbi:hypothetical protein JOM56_000260 [Amanita muscaria]